MKIICPNCGTLNIEPICIKEYDPKIYVCVWVQYKCFYCGNIIAERGTRSGINEKQLKKIIKKQYWKNK